MGTRFNKIAEPQEPEHHDDVNTQTKSIHYPEARLVLLGTDSSGKSTTFYQISEKYKEGYSSYGELKELTLKVWFNVLETAYILITTSKLIGLEKEGKEVSNYFKKQLCETRFGFQQYEDEYGHLLKNAQKALSPIFSKIIKIYTKYNPLDLVENLRKSLNIMYFDGMEQ